MNIIFIKPTQVVFKELKQQDATWPIRWVGGIGIGTKILDCDTGDLFDLRKYSSDEIIVKKLDWVSLSAEVIGDMCDDEIEDLANEQEKSVDEAYWYDKKIAKELTEQQKYLVYQEIDRRYMGEDCIQRIDDLKAEGYDIEWTEEDLSDMIDDFCEEQDSEYADAYTWKKVILAHFGLD